MEYICNKTASLLNLDIPKYYLIRYQGENKKDSDPRGDKEPGLITFVTRNFMQDYKGGTLHHIYKFLPKGEANHNCEKIINVLFQQTGRLVDIAKFIKICLFDSLIGNNDRHGRNLGIIDTGKHKKLAPMYDNPSFFGIEKDEIISANFNISGSIWTSFSKEPTLLDYIQEFKVLGFEKICLQFLDKAKSQSQKIIKEVEFSKISKKKKKAFIKFLNKQLKSMKGFDNV